MQQQKHLNEEDMAMCADAINNGTYNELAHEIKEHLENCDACSHEVITIAEISRNIEITIPKNVSKQLLKPVFPLHKLLWPVIAVAASVLIFLIFHFSGYLIKDNSNKKIIVKKEDTIPNNVDTNKANTVSSDNNQNIKISLLAYNPNNSLEKLYNNYRGAYRSNEIKVLTPEVFYPKATDSLRWVNSDNQLLYVEIFDNQENEMAQFSTKTNVLPLPKLTQGLYYWKLINEQYDLLYVGKLIIE